MSVSSPVIIYGELKHSRNRKTERPFYNEKSIFGVFFYLVCDGAG